MKLFLHKTGALLLILALFLSTTGISFYLHTCGCSQNDEISFYKMESFCSSSECNEEKENSEQLTKSTCCTDLYFFYKLPLTFIQTISSVINFTFDFSLVIFDTKIHLSEQNFCRVLPGLYHAPPTLFYGRHLIQILHTLKIPFPVL